MSRTTKHKRHQYNNGKPFQGKNPPKDLPQDDDKPSTICSPQEPITMSQDVPSTNETLKWFLLQDDTSKEYPQDMKP